MDTVEFFSRIIPRRGVKVLAKEIDVGLPRKVLKNLAYPSIDAMAEAALQMDARGETVYHACNGFGDWYFDEAENKYRIRTQTNVVACRALYDDIDVGEGKDYDDRKTAMEDVRRVVREAELPTPLVVYSGNGVHLYWTLDRDIEPDEWVQLSLLKRRVLSHFRLRVDNAVDCDLARVLRPVGTHNRKKSEARIVAAKNNPPVVSPQAMREALERCIVKHDVPLLQSCKVRRSNAFSALNKKEYPKAYAEILASQCKQIAWFKETGAPYEPVWYLCIGAVKHCVNGDSYIHQWSAKYPKYSEIETQKKIEHWQVGPPSCSTFKAVAPERCEGCKHAVSP